MTDKFLRLVGSVELPFTGPKVRSRFYDAVIMTDQSENKFNGLRLVCAVLNDGSMTFIALSKKEEKRLWNRVMCSNKMSNDEKTRMINTVERFKYFTCTSFRLKISGKYIYCLTTYILRMRDLPSCDYRCKHFILNVIDTPLEDTHVDSAFAHHMLKNLTRKSFIGMYGVNHMCVYFGERNSRITSFINMFYHCRRMNGMYQVLLKSLKNENVCFYIMYLYFKNDMMLDSGSDLLGLPMTTVEGTNMVVKYSGHVYLMFGLIIDEIDTISEYDVLFQVIFNIVKPEVLPSLKLLLSILGFIYGPKALAMERIYDSLLKSRYSGILSRKA